MITIAIVEDDKEYRSQYRDYLKQMEAQMGESFQIREFEDGDGILENYRADYDIILMDIEMSFVNGMEAAEEIRKLDHEVVIIFITNMPQYVMDGYKVQAFDYILKPITYYAFSRTLLQAMERMAARNRQYTTIPIKNGIQRIDIRELVYVEVMDHDLIYYTISEKYVTRGSMKEAEELLKDFHFFRCTKCYLINLAYVERVQNNDVLLGKYVVAVTRPRRKQLMDAINNYLNEISK